MSPMHIFWSVGSGLAIAQALLFTNNLLASGAAVSRADGNSVSTPVSASSAISIGQCAINGDYSWEIVDAESCKEVWKDHPWLLEPPQRQGGKN